MTWYANEILIPASPQAVARIAGDAMLKPFAYWIKDLTDYPWYSLEHKHELPEQGLIVIRPVCEATIEGDSWYSEPSLDWVSFPGAPQSSGLLDGGTVEQLGDYLSEEGVPPLTLRQFLADLSFQLNLPVLYYAASMWGGDVDTEYCLLYSPQEQLFLTRSQLGDSELGAEDSLRMGLSGIGIQLPTGFFAPHTRSFPWHEHRISQET